MLHSLHVKNLALVREADIEFGDGLNILTGETGAGKSVIMGSVNLALGAKASGDLIGHYGDSALVELCFKINDEEKMNKLKALDVYPEEGFITITRRIAPGRSVIKINGETASISGVKAVTELLIDIHGQHDHQSLLYKSKHLEIVDKYAKDELFDLKAELKSCYDEYVKCRERLADFTLNEEERRRNISFLKFEAEEIESAGLKTGEDEELEASYRFFVNSKKILEHIEAVNNYMSAGEMNARTGRSGWRKARSSAGRICQGRRQNVRCQPARDFCPGSY